MQDRNNPNPTMPPPHVLAALLKGRVLRWDRGPRRGRGRYEELADLVEKGSADDIEGFVAARYWIWKDGRHRQLTHEAIMEAASLRRAAKRKRQGLDVSGWIKGFREEEARGWADIEARAAERRAAGETRSIFQRILENAGRAPRPG
jgi:hypothetical protein